MSVRVYRWRQYVLMRLNPRETVTRDRGNVQQLLLCYNTKLVSNRNSSTRMVYACLLAPQKTAPASRGMRSRTDQIYVLYADPARATRGIRRSLMPVITVKRSCTSYEVRL